MNLKKRLAKDVWSTGIVFLLLIILVSVIFFQFNISLNRLIREADPTMEAMEHMLLDVYQDNVLLLDYLNTRDYAAALKFDKEVGKSNQRCKAVENNIENLIITEVIRDKETISDYITANKFHHRVEEIRDDLLVLHKKELATGRDMSEDKGRLLDEHSFFFMQAVNKFAENIGRINDKNSLLRSRLIFQSRMYFTSVFIMILVFLGVLIFKVRKVGAQIIKPMDEIADKTREYVDGNYNARLHPAGDISELAELQSNINNVFMVVEETAAKNADEKMKVESRLLRKGYIVILEFLKKNAVKNHQTTITDLKKHLGVTHPTVLARIKFLKEKGYITIIKEGREKILHLTSKGDEF